MKKLENGFHLKENHFAEWQKVHSKELKELLTDRDTPLTDEEKSKLPQFGYGKSINTKENKQLFPTSTIVTEIDVPPSSKSNLEEEFEVWSKTFIDIFKRIKADENINFWIMYLTSSMCGIRFILKLNKPVLTKSEYEVVSKQFLKSLSKHGVKEEYFDVKVNCAWYLPTFEKYYDERKKKYIFQSQTSTNKLSQRLFKEALKLTESKEKFIEGNRNNFIHQLTCNANRYGVERTDLLHLLDENDFNYSPKEVESSVNSVYQKNQGEFGKLKLKKDQKDATIPLNLQIKKLKDEPPIPLIWSGIKKGSMGFIFGPAKSGKSTFCECLAMSLASGLDKFMDIKIKEGPYKVLFISMEEHWQLRAERNTKQRKFLFNRYGAKFGDNLISSTEEYPNYIMNDRDIAFIEKEIKFYKPQIVIMDSLSHIIIDKIEESSKTNEKLLKLKEVTLNNEITLIIIHHSIKHHKSGLSLNTLAGSRILGQEADFIIGINKVGEVRYLKEVAFRYAESSGMVQTFRINEDRWTEPVKLEYESDILNRADGRVDNTNRDLILDYLKEKNIEVRLQELKDHFKEQISPKTVHNQLNKLIENDKVEKVAKGVYKLKV